MRSLKVIAMAAILATPLAQASGIAIVNSQKALQESAPAKAFEQKSQEKFSVQVESLKTAEASFKKQVADFERDKATMSDAEQSKMQLELRRKQEDLQYQGRALQQEVAQAQQAEINRLAPKLEQAISAVAESGGYDVIIEQATVRYAKPGLDITGKVIEKLNALAK
ncbi:OmpH family outer membrane protein [Sansalvadorimonas verongulae]|uniref:OmpH family outer membrane protein n=1 Tax=Sansalvadorimonas verongulae TaxID=2172824 RepID=UPI0012BCD440|nr:OmpH family outer membrane protein [Sansalvadorimonas verongulae]MTI14252.1 OmpH family outer membrane protein [Sansalvadorimonas verongulae]